MATRVEQRQIGAPDTIRDKPITAELASLLDAAAVRVGIDKVVVYSGGQPGTKGTSTGSTRHNGGRAADLFLLVGGEKLTFSDSGADPRIIAFVTECARLGAIGIGAGVGYMGPSNLHIGYGQTAADTTKVVWGKDGKSVNSPQWLRDAASAGWNAPAPLPRPRPPVPPPPDVEPPPDLSKNAGCNLAGLLRRILRST